MTTSVIHIKNAPAGWTTDPRYVYIGRPNPRRGLRGSKFANPFVVGKHGDRDEVIAMYADHIARTGLVHQVAELRGKVLVCWCKPLACHGDLLVKLVEQREADDDRRGMERFYRDYFEGPTE